MLSEDIAEKTRALEENKAEGYYDGLTENQIINLKTIRSDIWRTRLEVYMEHHQLSAPNRKIRRRRLP